MVPIYFQLFPDGEPEAARSFYEAIGRNVVLWGRVENTIDASMLRVRTHPKATKLGPAKIPPAFNKKIELWLDLFETEPLVAHHRKEARRFAEEAKVLAGRRNEVIHAAIHHFDQSIGGARALHVKHLKDQTLARTFQLRTVELEKLLDEVARLYNRLSVMAMTALFLSLSPDGIRVVARKSEGKATGTQRGN